MDDPNDIDACKFVDLLESLGLQQHVNQLTHVHGHTLDLIIARRAENIIHDSPRIDRYLSDHVSILCKLVSPEPPITVKKVKYRKIKSVDISALVNDLAESSFM